jgi:hypothetical protein
MGHMHHHMNSGRRMRILGRSLPARRRLGLYGYAFSQVLSLLACPAAGGADGGGSNRP